MYQALRLVKKIATELSFKKGENVVIYDVSNKTPLARYYIVCSADNERKINGLKEAAIEEVEKADGGHVGHVEGRRGESPWVIVDAHDIVIHIFDENERNRIRFDDIYRSCPTVEF